MEPNTALTPLRAIRAKCRDCMCNQVAEIRKCPITSCPLYPYRMGHRPKNSGAEAAEMDAASGEE